MTELTHSCSQNYSAKDYPLFKYLNFTKYKNEDDIVRRLNNYIPISLN